MCTRYRKQPGIPPAEKRHHEDLETGQWRIDEDPAGGTTGFVRVLTDNKEQAHRVQSTLANVVVETQKNIIPLQVTGDALVAGTFRRT